jgi:hypothetical protein
MTIINPFESSAKYGQLATRKKVARTLDAIAERPTVNPYCFEFRRRDRQLRTMCFQVHVGVFDIL